MSAARRLPPRGLHRARGDGRRAARPRRSLPDVELDEQPVRRGRDPADGRLASAGHARGVPRSADAVLKAPIGAPRIRRRGRPSRAGHAPAPGRARRVREPPARARQGAIDLLIVRELVGGLYFGARGVRDDGTVFDTCEYHPSQVERIARRGFELARTRRGKLTSVDKANVLETSRLWRRVVRRGRGRLPGRRARAHARRQRRDAARQRARAVRRDRDREHVRRHPLRPRRGDDRRARPRALGEPRRRRAGDLRAGPRLGARHRRPRDREPGGMLRSTALMLEHGARAAGEAARSTQRSSGRSRRRRRPTSAARPRRTSSRTPSSAPWSTR